MPGKLKYLKLGDAAWLREEHIDKDRSAKDIAAEVGCSFYTVHNALERHGIHKRRPRGYWGFKTNTVKGLKKLRAIRKKLGLCRDCGRTRTSHRSISRCPKCHIHKREYDQARVANGICVYCPRSVEPGKRYCPECRSEKLAYHLKYRLAKKQECFELLGGCFCRCCGETNIEALSVDHIDNDGAAFRRANGGPCHSTGLHLYKKIISGKIPKKSLQVLCMNCQFGRRMLGTCYHQTATREPFTFVA